MKLSFTVVKLFFIQDHWVGTIQSFFGQTCSPLTRDEAVLHANVWLFESLVNTCDGMAVTLQLGIPTDFQTVAFHILQ